MATSPEVSQDLCLERTRSLAGRMLEGGAACTLVAWRIGSQYDFVAHGLTAQGDIVVAVRPDEDCMLSTLPAGVGTVVRMDLVRHSHDVMLSVIAASAHLLGELVLLPNAAVARLLAEDQLPGRIAELARISGTRVGLVVTDRILVPDHVGGPRGCQGGGDQGLVRRLRGARRRGVAGMPGPPSSVPGRDRGQDPGTGQPPSERARAVRARARQGLLHRRRSFRDHVDARGGTRDRNGLRRFRGASLDAVGVDGAGGAPRR